ncbi:MAG: type I-PGING CRISPR-associated protein Cas8c/Csp2 [Bacteroidota bacterium]
MEYSHPYSRYGLALTMVENQLDSPDQVTNEMLIEELIYGLDHFRTVPVEPYEGRENVKYGYLSRDRINANLIKGGTRKGIFLNSSIITSDKGAKNAWKGIEGLIKKLQLNKTQSIDVTMSLYAASAKFNNGRKGQSAPKGSIKEIACAAITNITPKKPCLSFKSFKSNRIERSNSAIIPDLPLKELIDFIHIFKSLSSSMDAGLMFGRVFSEVKGKGDNKKVIYKPSRPRVFDGNFPNPPRSSYLGPISLLGAIGEWSKKVELISLGEKVLDRMKSSPLYMVSYGKAESLCFNHYVVELAKQGNLRIIIDSIFYSEIIGKGKRGSKGVTNNIDYQKFDLFAGRFLQLFNKPSFQDFLAIRAEYPDVLELLFNTYFIKMENIDSSIVQSARKLGRWLNFVAYLAAKNEYPNTKGEDFKKAKAKVLVEMESATFSARSGDALIGQVITRAGRLSEQDAPAEAGEFMEKTASGELPLENAKNLLMAFSRLRNTYEKPPNEEDFGPSEEDTSDYDQ